MGKKKKKKAPKAVRTPKKPFLQSIVIDGETILRQTQMLAREFQRRNGRITDG